MSETNPFTSNYPTALPTLILPTPVGHRPIPSTVAS